MNINLYRFIFVSEDEKFNCYYDKVNNENNNLIYVFLIFLLIVVYLLEKDILLCNKIVLFF